MLRIGYAVPPRVSRRAVIPPDPVPKDPWHFHVYTILIFKYRVDMIRVIEHISNVSRGFVFPTYPRMSWCAHAYLFHMEIWFWHEWVLWFGPNHCRAAYLYWKGKKC